MHSFKEAVLVSGFCGETHGDNEHRLLCCTSYALTNSMSMRLIEGHVLTGSRAASLWLFNFANFDPFRDPYPTPLRFASLTCLADCEKSYRAEARPHAKDRDRNGVMSAPGFA